MKNKLLAPLLLIACAFVLTQNCSPMQVSSDLAASGTLGALSLSPMTDTLNTGATLQYVATGGTAPYTFTVVNGLGTVTSTGFYTAPTSIPTTTTTTTNTATVEIRDSVGAIATATVTIVAGSGSGITATYTPSPATASTAITLAPTGGTSPYTYVLVTGSGTLNGNIYTTPSFSETATIQITDATGATGTVAVSVTGANSSITALQMTAIGTNVPGGNGCGAQYQQVGAVADVGNLGIYGDQVICGISGGRVVGQSVLANLYVTAGGSHTSGGLACPSGYNQTIGQFADCQVTGTCGGQQNFCAYFAPYQTGMNIIVNFYVTAENQHSIAGVPCAAGYSLIGTVADCGGGHCNGTQSFCVLYGN